MIASAKMPTPPLNLAAEPLSEGDLIYHRQRLRNRFFDCVLHALADRLQSQKISRGAIAKRMGKDPAQVSRLLSYPSNLTIDTLSDVLLALGADLTLDHFLVENGPRSNYEHPWSRRHQIVEAPAPTRLTMKPRSETSSAPSPITAFMKIETSSNG